MKDSILLELANRWQREATPGPNDVMDDNNPVGNAEARGRRQGLRECADGLRMLVDLLREKP